MCLALLAVFVSLICSTIAVSVPYSLCPGQPNGDFTIATVDAPWWPPITTDSDYIKFTGKLDVDVTSGAYQVVIWYEGKLIKTESFDINTLATLPWSQGEFSFIWPLYMSNYYPPGDYKIQFQPFDQTDNSITCGIFKFTR